MTSLAPELYDFKDLVSPLFKAANTEPPWNGEWSETNLQCHTKHRWGQCFSTRRLCVDKTPLKTTICTVGSPRQPTTWKSPMSCRRKQCTDSLCSVLSLTQTVYKLISADKLLFFFFAWNHIQTKRNRTSNGSASMVHCVPFKAVLEKLMTSRCKHDWRSAAWLKHPPRAQDHFKFLGLFLEAPK